MFVKEGGFTDADEESLVLFAAQAAAVIANARAHGEDGVQPADTAEPQDHPDSRPMWLGGVSPGGDHAKRPAVDVDGGITE